MTNTRGERDSLPAPKRQFDYRHLIPVAKLLIERGHLPIAERHKYGFCPYPTGRVCRLTRALTDADWEAVNDRFVIPDNVYFHGGMIRDSVNGTQIHGHDTITTEEGRVPIEVWESRQDWSDLPADVASAAPDA